MDYPDLDSQWVRDSTGIITAKWLAEKANPKAEVVWGHSKRGSPVESSDQFMV